MKELKFLTIFPDDKYFFFQSHLWLESLKEIGMSDKAIVLIFTPTFRETNYILFQPIIDRYPEVEFQFYKDEHNISSQLGIYIPILRPYIAWRYWTDHPEMKEKAVLYCDSDILFTKNFNIDAYIDDDVCYASDTNSYINASYFDSKIRDVLPEKLEEYKTIDVLEEASNIVGIDRKTCEKNNLHSGGTQYLFKNIDAEYWKKVMNDCIPIKQCLMNANKRFFANENKGYQSWVCDMFSVLWNIWYRGQELKIIPEMEFAWSSDPIIKLDKCGIYHNAGVTGEFMDGVPYFYKGKYHQGLSPFSDPHLDVVLNNEESKKRCTWWYAHKLDELRKKYNLT